MLRPADLYRVCLAGALACIPAASVAAQRADTTRADSVRLDPVVVTATRTPTPVSSVTQPVVVLSGGLLRRQGVTTVAQALREVPGAAVVESGSYGGVTSLFLRGGESRYTKVLVDGVPVNAVGGAMYFQNLTLDDVDRIEVVYGPTSALYGADAMAGVIQIFTRRGGAAPGIDASVRRGTYGSHDATLALHSGPGPVTGSLAGGWHGSNGTYAFNNRYRNGTLDGTLDIPLDSATRVHLTTRYNGAEYHFPTDYTGAPVDSNSYTTEHRLVAAADLSRAVTPWLTARLLGGANELHQLSEDLTHSTRAGVVTSTQTSTPSRDRRRFGEARLEAGGGGARLTAGAQYLVEEARSDYITRRYTTTPLAAKQSDLVTDNRRLTHGYYATLQGDPDRPVTFDGSARYDVHSDFGNVLTGRGGLSVEVWRDARVRASYGTAFNAPAFYETQGSAYNRPNPALRPERAHTLDVALEQRIAEGRAVVTLGGFDQRFSQLIQYVPGVYDASFNPTAPAYYDNLTAARSSGYEGTLRLAIVGALTGSASYGQTIARVTRVSPGYSGSLRVGDALLRRPSHHGTATLTYAPRGWSATLTGSYVGKRPDQDFAHYPAPTVTLPAYTRVDAAASADVLRDESGALALTLRVDNLLNRRYEEVLHFPAPGCAVFVGARLATGR